MSKSKFERNTSDKAVWEAWDEARRQHLKRYCDPKGKVDSATVTRWQFEQALTNLMAMLECSADIALDWGMDSDAMRGQREVEDTARKYRMGGSCLPFPGARKVCNQTAESAIRNYIELVVTLNDAAELCEKIKPTGPVPHIRAVLGGMATHLFLEGPERCAKTLFDDGHEQESIAMLREAVDRATKDGLPELKQLAREYEIAEIGQETKREPVTKRAGLILDKLRSLPEQKGMTTSALLAWLSKEHNDDVDDKTLRRKLKELEPYGLQNKPKIGYFVR